ncbi:tryptophan-rich sensory protein [Geodermatophilus arenarius]|uniref:TspO/MBR family protein n=1 Tax=Geodermatophilus arenarius TaxID=1137990 RepID=A0ABV9LE87_9ACTN
MRRPLLTASTAVGLTALVGSAGTDVGSSWYRGLDTPRWQPPGPVFGIAWTALYALLAFAGGRLLERGDPADARALAGNLVLNAGWTWAFFRAHRPPLAAAEAALLAASTADLTRRAGRVDRAAGRALLPYAAWTAFATVLSAEIARRNRR